MNKLVCSTGTALANPADYRKRSWIRERLWRMGVRGFFPIKLLGIHTDIEKEVKRAMTYPSIYRGSFEVNTRIGRVLVYLHAFAPEGSEGCSVYLLLEGSRSQFTSFFSSRDLPLAHALCEYINRPKEDHQRGKILRPVEYVEAYEAGVNRNTWGQPIDVVASVPPPQPKDTPEELAIMNRWYHENIDTL